MVIDKLHGLNNETVTEAVGVVGDRAAQTAQRAAQAGGAIARTLRGNAITVTKFGTRTSVGMGNRVLGLLGAETTQELLPEPELPPHKALEVAMRLSPIGDNVDVALAYIQLWTYFARGYERKNKDLPFKSTTSYFNEAARYLTEIGVPETTIDGTLASPGALPRATLAMTQEEQAEVDDDLGKPDMSVHSWRDP